MSDHEHPDDGQVHSHISSIPFYLGIFFALIVLTIITYALSWVHLGSLNLTLAIGIATVKASLVVLYFMHLWWDKKFNALIFIGTLVFMGIFLVYTMNDTETRQVMDESLNSDPRGRLNSGNGAWAGGLGDRDPGDPIQVLGDLVEDGEAESAEEPSE